MPTSLEKSDETSHRIYQSWSIGIYALPALLGLALLGFAMSHPGTANWISDAVQAEFASTNPEPDVAQTQLAQPAKESGTVKIN